MESIYLLAAFWFFAAVLSTILANRLKISIALMEIIVGAAIGYAAYYFNLLDNLSLNADWMKLLTGVGAIMLTFLAGAELNPDAMKSKLKKFPLSGWSDFSLLYRMFSCRLLHYWMESAGKPAVRHRPFHNFNGCSLRGHAGVWI